MVVVCGCYFDSELWEVRCLKRRLLSAWLQSTTHTTCCCAYFKCCMCSGSWQSSVWPSVTSSMERWHFIMDCFPLTCAVLLLDIYKNIFTMLLALFSVFLVVRNSCDFLCCATVSSIEHLFLFWSFLCFCFALYCIALTSVDILKFYTQRIVYHLH